MSCLNVYFEVFVLITNRYYNLKHNVRISQETKLNVNAPIICNPSLPRPVHSRTEVPDRYCCVVPAVPWKCVRFLFMPESIGDIFIVVLLNFLHGVYQHNVNQGSESESGSAEKQVRNLRCFTAMGHSVCVSTNGSRKPTLQEIVFKWSCGNMFKRSERKPQFASLYLKCHKAYYVLFVK